jgi:hypothetical protein
MHIRAVGEIIDLWSSQTRSPSKFRGQVGEGGGVLAEKESCNQEGRGEWREERGARSEASADKLIYFYGRRDVAYKNFLGEFYRRILWATFIASL